MRLIDADALAKDIETFNRPLCDDYHMKGYVLDQIITDIKNAPTVEAIPIEYIEREIDAWNRTKVQAYHAICYRHLIDDWRREQDILETTRNYSKRGDDNETN